MIEKKTLIFIILAIVVNNLYSSHFNTYGNILQEKTYIEISTENEDNGEKNNDKNISMHLTQTNPEDINGLKKKLSELGTHKTHRSATNILAFLEKKIAEGKNKKSK